MSQCSMTSEITVRVLGESDWQLYREVWLQALRESPQTFTATFAEQSDRPQEFWRDQMTRSSRLLAEREQQPQGIVSLGTYAREPAAAEIFGLYVVPQARGTGVSWRLVEAAADLARDQGFRFAFYWVGVDNGRAIGFAENFGFRTTGSRRSSRRGHSDAVGEEQVALILPLEADATEVPNPTSDRPPSLRGPWV